MRALILLSLVVGISGCNRAYSDAMTRADESLKRGDLSGAIEQYLAACEAKPGSDACDSVKDAALDLKKQELPTAQKECAAGQFFQCLQRVRLLRIALPDPDVDAVVAQASAGLEKGCRSARPQGLVGELYLPRCVSYFTPFVNTEPWAALEARVRAEAADQYLSAASTQESTNPGVSWAFSSVAQCLSGGKVPPPMLDQRWAAFSMASQQRVQLSVNGSDDPRSCQAVQTALVRELRCDSGQPTMKVGVMWNAGALRHTSSDIQQSKRYVERVIRQENPVWVRQKDYVNQLRIEMQRAERQAVRSRAACSSSTSDNSYACNESRELVDAYNRHTYNLNHEVDVLNRTPQILEEPVYATHQWVQRQHHFEWPFLVQLTTPSGSRTLERSITLETVEQGGFPPAGVETQRYTELTPTAFTAAVMQGLPTHVIEQLKLDFQAMSAKTEQTLQGSVALQGGRELNAWLWNQYQSGGSPVALWLARADNELRQVPSLPFYPMVKCN